ncbi:MAG: YdcF family protein [Gemmatimonadaceae bacterium]
MSSRGWRGAKVVAGIVVVTALLWVTSAVLVLVWSRLDRARAADAIVVLGAAQYAGKPSPVLRARLDHGIALWRRGLAPRLILTGGIGDRDTTSEAAVSRRYALRRGVPDSVIMLETKGRTSSASLRTVARMLKASGRRDVVLVSDPFHMLRLHVIATRFGLRPYTSPTPSSRFSTNGEAHWRYVFSESLKVPLTLVVEWDTKQGAAEAAEAAGVTVDSTPGVGSRK